MRIKNQAGVAIVEFALILPILIVLAVGISEFSLMLYDQAMLTNASREGARAGIVSQDPRVTNTEIKQVVKDYLGKYDKDGKLIKSYLVSFKPGTEPIPDSDPDPTPTEFGDELTVTVTYEYTFLVLPKFIVELAGLKTLTAKTVMRME